MSSSVQVPKQFYGYTLQEIEFVSLLIDATPGTTVSLEVFEDVGSTYPDGTIVATQVKAGSGQNPISDSSIELWKTIRNWIDAVNNGQLDASATWFEIYVGSKKKGALCDGFRDATDELTAKAAIQKARNKFYTKSEKMRSSVGDELKQQLRVVFLPANEKLLQRVIARFRYRCGTGAAFSDLSEKLEKALIEKDVIADVLLHALGWVRKTVGEKIEQGEPANVLVDDFRGEIAAFRARLKGRDYLASFAGDPTRDEIESNRLKIYVRQLHLIDASEEEVYEAITDYLKTKANTIEFARRYLVHESSLEEFAESLIRLWRNVKTRIALEGTHQDAVHFGKKLANACLSERRELEGMSLPDGFTPGTFHALADDLDVGWHPDYVAKIKGVSS